MLLQSLPIYKGKLLSYWGNFGIECRRNCISFDTNDRLLLQVLYQPLSYASMSKCFQHILVHIYRHARILAVIATMNGCRHAYTSNSFCELKPLSWANFPQLFKACNWWSRNVTCNVQLHNWNCNHIWSQQSGWGFTGI